jgi:penicillin-binding protein 1A
LLWYLNTNFYGNLATGVEVAAQVYFGKHVWELDLAESAMLAPIPQFPALNPIDNLEEAKKRQDITLDRMVEEGYLTPEEAEAAKVQKPRRIAWFHLPQVWYVLELLIGSKEKKGIRI